MATDPSKPNVTGQTHLQKTIDQVTGAHVARDRGRSTIDDILSDGKPSMIRIMADGARFDYDRAMAVRAEAEACADQKQKEKLEEEASRLHQLASKQAKEPAAYLHPKLSSIDHNGLPPAVNFGERNVFFFGAIDSLAAQLRKTGLVIDADAGAAGGAEVGVALLGAPGAENAAPQPEDIRRQLADMVASLRPGVRKDPVGGGSGSG